MDLAALLDFIYLGIGRLDLLALVELSRDPGLSDRGEHLHQLREGPNGVPRGNSVTGASLPTSFAQGQSDLGHTSCDPLWFPQPPQGDGVSQ